MINRAVIVGRLVEIQFYAKQQVEQVLLPLRLRWIESLKRKDSQLRILFSVLHGTKLQITLLST